MRITLAVIVACLMVGAACGESGSPAGPSGAGGTFSLMLKDSPFSDAKSVLVTFSRVTAHRDTEDAFATLPFSGGATSRTCDLKKLENAQDILGVGTLAAGRYTQVRLVVSTATIYFDNAATGPACAASIAPPSGNHAALEIPSDVVRLNRQFEVSANGATTMLIDFDGERSIHQTGNGRGSAPSSGGN